MSDPETTPQFSSRGTTPTLEEKPASRDHRQKRIELAIETVQSDGPT
jgi:hypothetical protein